MADEIEEEYHLKESQVNGKYPTQLNDLSLYQIYK